MQSKNTRSHTRQERTRSIRVRLLGVAFGQVGQPLRPAVTGHDQFSSIDITLELMGKQETITRLTHAITFIDASANQD